VADPARAVAEIARVVRPGGRVVLWEPDWGTLMVAADPAEVGALVCRRRAAAFRHPHVGRDLPALAAVAGLAVEEVRAGVHLSRDPVFAEAQFGFVREARAAAHEGEVPAAEVAAWEEDLARRAAEGTSLTGLTAVVVIARRP
jgi:SAM-dependent methyltransferase